MQSALLQSFGRGERITERLAPEMADLAFRSPAISSTAKWQRNLTRQLGQKISVRLMEKTRVAASNELASRHGKNVKLITSWTEGHYTNYQNAFNDAIRRAENTGKPVNTMEIARTSIAQGDVPPNKKIRNRARLIARDQQSKFATAVDRTRATKLGAEYYQWRSVKDERVRPDHETWNGHYFRKDGKEVDRDGKLIKGGMDTHDEQPGDAVQCRCVAAWKFNF